MKNCYANRYHTKNYLEVLQASGKADGTAWHKYEYKEKGMY